MTEIVSLLYKMPPLLLFIIFHCIYFGVGPPRV